MVERPILIIDDDLAILQTVSDILFEVDPNQIEDLTLEIWPNEVITGYQQRVRIPLGLKYDNAEQWRAAARGQATSSRSSPWRSSSSRLRR